MATKIYKETIKGGKFGGEFQEFTFSDSKTYTNLEETARLIAQACIMTYNIRFDSSAITELFSLIEKGSDHIKEKKDEDKFEKIAEAQKNLIMFIYEIAAFAKENNLTSVDGKLIQTVQKEASLCPVYPFDNF